MQTAGSADPAEVWCACLPLLPPRRPARRPAWSRSGVAAGALLFTPRATGPQAPAVGALDAPHAAGSDRCIWSEALDKAAFEAFKEKGLFDQPTARAFRVPLERGGSQDAMAFYKAFRGKEPRVEPLLKARGLKEVAGAELTSLPAGAAHRRDGQQLCDNGGRRWGIPMVDIVQ